MKKVILTVLILFVCAVCFGQDYSRIEEQYPELGDVTGRDFIMSTSFDDNADFFDTALSALKRRTEYGNSWFKMNSYIVNKDVTIFLKQV
ncbi:hypothetical protein LJC14_07630 [Treponema sp. OttesenSCG-928-L16]|nr:hypothetical protein [Treponema sp. OttesenSCG-928-L16]